MGSTAKAAIVAAAIALVLASLAGTASAITASPAGSIQSTSLGLITFRSEAASVQCRVTLRGEVERSIANTEGAFFANFASGSANECRGGNATLLVNGSNIWTALLRGGFILSGETGEVALTVVNVEFLIEIFGVSCLYGGGIGLNLAARGRPLVTELLTILSTSVTKVSGSFLCPATVSMSGRFGLTRQTLTLP